MDDSRLDAMQGRLVALLDSLGADWLPVSDNVALYLLCGAGLAELHFSGRAWTTQSALDFEATACGVWIDAERKSVLPDEIRHVVPAWAGQAVSVQLNTPVQARLTPHGETCKRELHDTGPELFLAYVCSHPLRGRVTVRLLGNEGPAPGAAPVDSVSGEIVKCLQSIAESQKQIAAAHAPRTQTTDNAAAIAKLLFGGARRHRNLFDATRYVAIRDSDGTIESKLRRMDQIGLPPDVSASTLAEFLGCDSSAIKKTKWWRQRMATRKQRQADAETPYVKKYSHRRPRWQRHGSGPALG